LFFVISRLQAYHTDELVVRGEHLKSKRAGKAVLNSPQLARSNRLSRGGIGINCEAPVEVLARTSHREEALSGLASADAVASTELNAAFFSSSIRIHAFASSGGG